MIAKKVGPFDIPAQVHSIAENLKEKGFKAFLVGGCTRDLLTGRKPKDWDITTDATPNEIISIFGDQAFYENNFGTVAIINKESNSNEIIDETVKIIEVTTFRIDASYSDQRRPDSVTFSKELLDDLKRRDYTINAIAIEIQKSGEEATYNVLDPHNGIKDIKDKIIRTVGDANARFSEDALRIMRGVRLMSELNFRVDENTEKSMMVHVKLLSKISRERIRDEFIKILMSDNPFDGLNMCMKVGILDYISPDLERSTGIKQNEAHAYDVWEHLLHCVRHSAKKKYPLEVRLAALFHDIGKPKSRRWSEKKKDWTFHGHEVIGERVTRENLENLKFPRKILDEVCKLVRWHMFFSDTEQISLSAVRRMVANVGKESIWKLMDVRTCDRIGTGRPKENPYRLRKYRSLIEQVMSDPVSVSMLKIDGSKIMEITHLAPGPKIGHILHALLEEVLENPEKNTAEYLKNRVVDLSKMEDIELDKLGRTAREKKKKEEDQKVEGIRKKYFVE